MHNTISYYNILTFHRVDTERRAGHLLEFDPTSVHRPFDAHRVVKS